MGKKASKLYLVFLVPIFFVVFSVICLAVISPMSRKTQRIDLSGYEPAFSQKNTDAALNDCRLEGETFVAAGNDPYVVFDCSSEKIMAISVTFDDNATDDTVVLY